MPEAPYQSLTGRGFQEVIFFVEIWNKSGMIIGIVLMNVLRKNGAKNIILILVKFEKNKIFNASTCGDNCAKWLLKIAEKEDRTINLRHLMKFGETPFEIRILNTNQIVHTMDELVSIAGEFV